MFCPVTPTTVFCLHQRHQNNGTNWPWRETLNQSEVLLLTCCVFLGTLPQRWKSWVTFTVLPSPLRWELALKKVLVWGKSVSRKACLPLGPVCDGRKWKGQVLRRPKGGRNGKEGVFDLLRDETQPSWGTAPLGHQ